MWFASILYGNGTITGDQFAEAVCRQLKKRPILGKIAVQEGMLTMRQARQIISTQADCQEKPFGKIAIELEMLSEKDVAYLLAKQESFAPSLGEILVDMGVFTHDELLSHLRQAHNSLGKVEHKPQRDLIGAASNYSEVPLDS